MVPAHKCSNVKGQYCYRGHYKPAKYTLTKVFFFLKFFLLINNEKKCKTKRKI